jgi:uncharacterized membrane protein YbaN (DUF454 family)
MELMIKHTKRTLLFLIAVLFVIIGLAGIILPLIPGLVFIALALIIFSLFFPVIGEKARNHTVKYPKLHAIIEELDERVRRIVGEI